MKTLGDTSIAHDDMRIEIQDLPELQWDDEAEARGTESTSAIDRRSTTAFVGAEDSFLGSPLGVEECSIAD